MNPSGGILDIHLHGAPVADASNGSIGDVIRLATYHGSKGTDKIVVSIYPDDIGAMRRAVEAVAVARDTIRRESRSDCAEIVGVHLEGPFLNPLQAGALKKDALIVPSEHAFDNLIEGAEDLVQFMTIAPELANADKIIRRCRDRGIAVSMGHSEATFADAAAGKNAGATGITHLFNAMRPFHHREPGLAGFGLLDPDVYIEVIADGVHLHVSTLELVFRVKHPGRIIIVTDAVKGSRARNTAVYESDGTLAGGGITLKDAADFLINNGFDKETVFRAVSENPLRFLTE